MQVAYAVDDVRVAASRWIARGVGPFLVRDHIAVDHTRVGGQPTSFDHSSAFAWWGELMLELICQHDRPADPLVGTSGVHHVAFFVDDFAQATADLSAMGYPEVLYAEAGELPFAFHDARAELGHHVEIYEATDGLRSFYDLVRTAAAEWSADPQSHPAIRTLT